MTALLLALLLEASPSAAPGAALPPERRHVYDLAGLLSAPGRESLESRLQATEAGGGPRIVLLATTPPARDREIWGEALGARAAALWGLDTDKDRVSILYIYCGWPFQQILSYGRPISKQMDDRLSIVFDVANAVLKRDPNHDRAIAAGLDAMEAVLAGHSAAMPTPPPYDPGASGWVKDEAGILGESTVALLNGLLAGHEKATSNQVVVLTVTSLEGDTVDAVALKRATEMGIGRKDKDNGILLLVAPNERKVRIEVGYGLEGTLPDARAAQIVRNEILPRFQDGDLSGGIEAGVRAILGSIEGTYSPSAAVRDRGLMESLRVLPTLGVSGQFLVGFFGGVFLVAVGIALWGSDNSAGRWIRMVLAVGAPLFGMAVNYPFALIGTGIVGFALLKQRFAPGSADATFSSSGSSGSSWSSGSSSPGDSFSSSSSGSSSGSTFSGGGGSFGGGGASGSW